MSKTIKIGERKVGEREPTFIIAEISCNHLQKKELALRLIEEAKKAGADAVKFQTYTPDTMTIDCDNEHFNIKDSIWKGMTLYKLYEEAYTPWEWTKELKEKAEEVGLVFFSTPFDETAVDFLENFDVPAYKIASFEINHIPLLKKVARTGKPVIFSTGLATREDIELALQTIRNEGNDQIAVLKCTSSYPAPVDAMNLRMIKTLIEEFGVVSGLSDHTMNIIAPATSIALGGSIIEKHFILDRNMGGHDVKFSLEPREFKEMVNAVREIEKAIGNTQFELSEKQKEHTFLMRSIFVVEDVKKGEEFTPKNLRVIRPGNGLHPKHYEGLIGKKAAEDIARGTPARLEMAE
jgi:pseudaminic acid synthase